MGLHPKIDHCRVDQLVPYQGNARTHSPAQIDQIAKSIERFGFTNPILIGDDYRICQSITAGTPLEEICEKEGLSRRRLLQLVDHGLLAPDLVRKVLEGHQPVSLTSEWLQRNALPLDWQEQRRVIGFL